MTFCDSINGWINRKRSGDYCRKNMGNQQEIMTHGAPPSRLQMDRYSGFGLPTYPPSQDIPVAVSPLREWVFVPVTAAGQLGICTPLPHIHLKELISSFYRDQERLSIKCANTRHMHYIKAMRNLSGKIIYHLDSHPCRGAHRSADMQT